MSRLIGFTGRMGSGKSTAIAALKESIHRHVELVKFAQPLYDIQETIYKRIQGVYKRPESFIKDRKLLQFIGTDWGRGTISDTIWVDLWKKEVNYILENYQEIIVVCDDVRFDNEAELIKKMGGSIIKMTTDKERIDMNAGFSGHASEAGVDLKYIDYIIENNGTVQDLKDSLLAFNSKTGLL